MIFLCERGIVMKNKKIHYAWIILVVMCIIRSLAAAGINNSGGLFLKPVSDALGIGVGNLSIYLSISAIATLFFMPVAGKIMNKYSAKWLIIAAVLLQAGSFIALGFMSNVWAWYILAIPMGIGGALLVNLIGPILINRWFRKNAGVALGIMMASVGVFGIVINPVMSNAIANIGWQSSYVYMGAFVLLTIVVLAFFFVKNQPSDIHTTPLGEGQGDEVHVGEKTGVSVQIARKAKSFYLLIFFMISITAFGAFNQHIATYAAALGYDANTVGTILALSSLGSTLGAIIIGVVSDKMGVYKTTLGIIGVVICSLICLFAAGISSYIFMLGSFLLGLGAIGIPVLGPLLAKSFFGDKDYEEIYSNVMMGPPLATILLLPLYGFLYDATGNYVMVIIIISVLTILGGICIIIGNKSRIKY